MASILGLETEGIFRRSANATVLKQVQKSFNDGRSQFLINLLPLSANSPFTIMDAVFKLGQPVDFAKLGDVHIPAALIKSFLRQLPEPILTYDLYDHIVHVQCECLLYNSLAICSVCVPHDTWLFQPWSLMRK